MKNKANVLDHGFVVLRNMAGPTRRVVTDEKKFLANDRIDGADELRAFDADDTDIANSARMSFEGQDQDRTYAVEMALNRFLMLHKHMTPFESIEVWLEMKLPIFVARQFVRHRTASLNEVSARYVKLPAEWYVPALEDIVMQAPEKKQGGVAIDLNNGHQITAANFYRANLHSSCAYSYGLYESAIAHGIAMEQARLHLHLNHYTHWLWKQDLRNLMHFLALRQHSSAQGEPRKYATAIVSLLEPHIPGLMGLYRELILIPEKLTVNNDSFKLAEMRTAMQAFIDRVDNGEIRSVATYNKFKSILATS